MSRGAGKLLATHWRAAALAGFAKPADWQRWADRLILQIPAPLARDASNGWRHINAAGGEVVGGV